MEAKPTVSHKNSDETVAELKRLLAEKDAALVEKDAKLSELNDELDSLHDLVEQQATINVGTLRFNTAIEEADKLRADVVSWFVSGQELTPVERRRLRGSGIRRLGFINKAIELMRESPNFIPDFLSLSKFEASLSLLNQSIILNDILRQTQRLVNDVLLILGDQAYRQALIYYGALREASLRGVPGAREQFLLLREFFRRGMRDAPTEQEVERDLHALMHGHKDGRIVVEHEAPHLTGGKHEVIDETHKTNKELIIKNEELKES